MDSFRHGRPSSAYGTAAVRHGNSLCHDAHAAKKEGGLGIRALETDYEIKVANVAKGLTRRTKFYMDAYLKRSRIDIEYNGFHHDTEENRAIDEERKNALAAMGYGIITISRHSLCMPSRLPGSWK